MRGAPHLQPLPGCPPLLYPGRQLAGRRASHRNLISRIDGSLNQIPDAHGHTIDGGLGNDENARGFSRRRKGNRTPVTADSQPASKLTAPLLPLMLPKLFHLLLVPLTGPLQLITHSNLGHTVDRLVLILHS